MIRLLVISTLVTLSTCQTPPANLPKDVLDNINLVFGQNPNMTVPSTVDNPINIEPTTAQTILTDSDGAECVCVPYYLCDVNTNTTLTDGSIDGFGVIDIRFRPESCQDALDVCCMPSKQVSEPLVPKPKPDENKPTGCGIRNTNGIDFKITGNSNNEAEFGEFPWTVALLRNSDDKCQCGGSLIHPQVVLTGAHCVRDKPPSALRVRAGEWDTQTTKERLPYQERQVQRIIQHPRFNPNAVYNNVALLILNTPVELAQHINTVCLPEQGYIPADRKCIATGWGKDIFGQSGHYQVIMKRVELPIVPRDKCQDTLRTTRLGSRFSLHESFICAGGEKGKDTCQGDGGAPLVCPIQNTEHRYQQCGIVSWGIGCGDNIPAVYTNVPLFRQWIDGHMESEGFGTASYVF